MRQCADKSCCRVRGDHQVSCGSRLWAETSMQLLLLRTRRAPACGAEHLVRDMARVRARVRARLRARAIGLGG